MRGVAVRILAVLVTLAALYAARADYLYWMIDGDNLELEGEAFSDYAFARVKDLQSGQWLHVYDASGSQTAATAADKATVTSGPMLWGAFDKESSSPDRLFLFELYNDDREVVAWQTVLFSYLLEQYNIGDNLNPAFTPYMLTSVVPEPTGGTLVLLGAAMLALRRKKGCA